ncbi:MAG: hypothetical protein Q3X99_02990 [Faecalibacterium sp.]|nr:hypothetical protein [Faecalibacterium sp.]
MLLYVIFYKNTRKGRGHWLCKTKLASDKHPPYYTTLHRGCTVQIVGFTAFCALFAWFLFEKRANSFDSPRAALRSGRGMLKAGCAEPIKTESMTNKEKQSVNKL